MKGTCPVFQSLAAAISGSMFLATQAGAAPPAPAFEQPPMFLVQADCYTVGEQIAAENGGTLAKASLSTEGGRPVCVVVILVPGKEGERPRRLQMVVPQG